MGTVQENMTTFLVEHLGMGHQRAQETARILAASGMASTTQEPGEALQQAHRTAEEIRTSLGLEEQISGKAEPVFESDLDLNTWYRIEVTKVEKHDGE